MAQHGNSNLHSSRNDKADEFYTQISFIENELKHYKDYFKDKVIFCNCDDPEWSNFWKYFQINFFYLGIKKLISTHYEIDKPSYKMEIIAADIPKSGQFTIPDYVKTPLKQNGDFRSPECIEILKEADIIITNPPFSLFREYIAQLIEYKKDFIIVGNQNAITYREVLPLIMQDKVWLGYNSGHFWFRVPDYYEEKKTDFKIDENGVKWRRMGNICWFTNIDIEKRHEEMKLFKSYTPEEYPHYDNYDAIEVSKTADIPCDYYGVIGVPITFMTKHNPEQFEIVGVLNSGSANEYDFAKAILNGKQLYARVLIRRKQVNANEN